MQSTLFKHLNNAFQVKVPRLHILIFHRVMPEPDPLRPWEIDQRQFEQQLRWVSETFRVISLSQAIDELSEKRLKRRSLVITFDDGYLDNATHALPCLKSMEMSATFFCTSAWLNGGLMWNDQIIESIRRWPLENIKIPDLDLNMLPVRTIEEKRHAIQTILPRLKYKSHAERSRIASQISDQTDATPELMMSPEHIQQLHRAGMEIGGHTHSHPILAQIDDTLAHDELAINKSVLEDILGEPIRHFAYPNGKPELDFLPKHKQMVSNLGYQCALTTEPNLTDQCTDIFAIPRFTPWDKTQGKYLLRLTKQNL